MPQSQVAGWSQDRGLIRMPADKVGANRGRISGAGTGGVDRLEWYRRSSLSLPGTCALSRTVK